MIKKQILFHVLLILFFIFTLKGSVWAITITASPNPATVSNSVTFRIGVSSPDGACDIFIEYGDIRGSTLLGPVSGNRTLTATHTYSQTGVYTVRAFSTCPSVVAPNPAYLSLRVETAAPPAPSPAPSPDPTPDPTPDTPESPEVATPVPPEITIQRIETKFENNRPEITIQRKEPVPDLSTTIRFTGSGLLKGYWEVDGFKRNYVFKHLSVGPEAIITYPNVPPLPNFTPGSHIVRFVITHPALNISFPKAVYYVTAEDYIPISKITFLVPSDTAELEYTSVLLKWQAHPSAKLYLVHIFAEKQLIPIFSAYSEKNSYRLRQDTLTSRLAPGKHYYLQVLGFSKDTTVIAQSEKTDLTFK